MPPTPTRTVPPTPTRTVASYARADDAFYARPSGVPGGFAPHQPPPAYAPPPPTVSPGDQAVFGRPAGGGPFAPGPGERLAPQASRPEVVPNVLADTFGAGRDAQAGFAPEPGTRIGPGGPPPESPWWKPGARRDPWRDPTSGFWLGGGAVFRGDRAEQVLAEQDAEADTAAPATDTGDDEELDDRQDNVRRLRFGLPALVVTLVIAVLAGAVGGGAGWLITRTSDDALHRPDVSIAKVKTPVQRSPTSVAGIAKRVGPAVVSIAVQTTNELAIGSGVVIDRDGDVLTNNHVISGAVGDSSAKIVVTFSNEDTAAARIVGHDPTSDLAVVKVPNTKLTVAQLGDSAGLAVGDPVIAIGSPLGLQGTVTSGIVSALNRPVHAYNDDGSSDAYLDAIQTDAPINPGNSGGALVNSSGAVIGINSAAALGSTAPNGTSSSANGIGYAIPINYARKIALDLIHTGTTKHANLGAQGKTRLSGLLSGAYIEQISPGGAAARAGLKVGDTIVAAGGQITQSFDQLVVIVQSHEPGDSLSVTYYARGASAKKTTTVTLG